VYENQSFFSPIVQLIGNFGQVLLGVLRLIRSFGEVLSEQADGIFVLIRLSPKPTTCSGI
jgi:hypothetical protein